MLLTISTTHQPATDLGYLLHKNPARLQTEDLSFGKRMFSTLTLRTISARRLCWLRSTPWLWSAVADLPVKAGIWSSM